MIRVLLVDDQASVRRSFRTLLGIDGDIAVVAEAADGVAAIRAARSCSPDVVLMDVRMPGGDGITATAALAGPRVQDRLPVVVITTFDLDATVFAALEAGAAGFVLKDAPAQELRSAVRAAHDGDGLVSPRVTRRIIEEFARRGARATDTGECGDPDAVPDFPSASDPPLTAREREVLAAIAAGLSNREIADRFFVEMGTVKTHVSRVIAKLGVRDRVQAAILAHRTPDLLGPKNEE